MNSNLSPRTSQPARRIQRILHDNHRGLGGYVIEHLDEPLRWLRELTTTAGLSHRLRVLEKGIPELF